MSSDQGNGNGLASIVDALHLGSPFGYIQRHQGLDTFCKILKGFCGIVLRVLFSRLRFIEVFLNLQHVINIAIPDEVFPPTVDGQ